MLRISAFIAALVLIGTTAHVLAQPQTKSGTTACTLDKCLAACQKEGSKKSCDRYCQQRMAAGACS
jgi:hypothetical protein